MHSHAYEKTLTGSQLRERIERQSSLYFESSGWSWASDRRGLSFYGFFPTHRIPDVSRHLFVSNASVHAVTPAPVAF